VKTKITVKELCKSGWINTLNFGDDYDFGLKEIKEFFMTF